MPPEKPATAKPDKKKHRRPALPLSDKAADIIRKTAKYTGLSQEDVKLTVTIRDAKIMPGGDALSGRLGLDEIVELICRGITDDHDKARSRGEGAGGGDQSAGGVRSRMNLMGRPRVADESGAGGSRKHQSRGPGETGRSKP